MSSKKTKFLLSDIVSLKISDTQNRRVLTMKKWRIDRAYETIYKYDEHDKVYYFYCSFYSVNINKKMSDKKIIQILEKRQS